MLLYRYLRLKSRKVGKQDWSLSISPPLMDAWAAMSADEKEAKFVQWL